MAAAAIVGTGLAIGAQTSASEHSAARVFDIDPSIRSSGMGGASTAVFWGDDTNDWANPALLGLRRDLSYQWGTTDVIPGFSSITFTTHQLSLGAGGIGVSLPGATGEDGSALLDYPSSESADDQGNPTGTFGSQEAVRSWGIGVSLPSAVESLLRLAGYEPPRLSRSFDAAFGFSRDQARVALGPTAVTETKANDFGMFLRATLLDDFDQHQSGFPLRFDVSYGYSARDGAAGLSFSRQEVPTVRSSRSGFALHFAAGAPAGASKRHWLSAESLTPLISVGLAADARRSENRANANYGGELTLVNMLSVRAGSVQDDFTGIHAASFGAGLGYRYRNIWGIRYDWATFPNSSGVTNSYRNGVTVFANLVGVIHG